MIYILSILFALVLTNAIIHHSVLVYKLRHIKIIYVVLNICMLIHILYIPFMSNPIPILLSTLITLLLLYILYVILSIKTLIKYNNKTIRFIGILFTLLILLFTMNTSLFEYFVNQAQ